MVQVSGTNDSFTFGSSCCDFGSFEELPKGVMFSIGMNPYNGLVLVRYNHGPVALRVIEQLNRELFERVTFLSDAVGDDVGISELAAYCKGDLTLDDFEPCPFCGGIPIYHPCVGEGGAEGGFLECCCGSLLMSGFRSRSDAVSAWNSRRLFRVKVA